MMQSQSASRIGLKFWGVRGSIPTPELNRLGYGGNTTCVEIGLAGDRVIVIDGGSGARPLGNSLIEGYRGRKLEVCFLMTHFHWDHIQGLPFFAPLYFAGNRIEFYSSLDEKGIAEALQGQMTRPYFPVSFDRLPASKEFLQIKEPFSFGSFVIRPFPLNHPQGATGFRIEANGQVIVHASDFEHGDEKLDMVLRDFSQGADTLIYDAQYTPQEYENKRGWGHSTWLEASKVARDARVKRLILFHHDPGHDDVFMRGIVDEARSCFEPTDAAIEGGPALS